MTDPVLHELSIMDTLDCRCVADNAARLQAGALMSLVDAYDRKLTRDNFIALAGAALALHTQAGKLFIMSNTAEQHAMEVLDGPMLTRAVHGITRMAEDAHTALIGLMDKVVLCPTSNNKVH